MAIAPESPALEIPTGTAVSRFVVDRLGAAPSLTVTMADTVEDVVAGDVVTMIPALDFDAAAPTYRGMEVQFAFLITTAVFGLNVVRASTGQVVGSILGGSGRMVYFNVATSLDLSGETVTLRRRNPFGVPALRKAKESPERHLSLQTADPAQFTRMATLMITAHVRAVLAVLPGLGVDASPSAVQAAVLGASDNLESILASEFETLELERRAGTFIGSVRE